MNRVQMEEVMRNVFNECYRTHQVANREYATNIDALSNFKDCAAESGITPAQNWHTLASKHWRGICSFIRGFKAQREDVRGRINDLIVYLVLLRAMIDEEQGIVNSSSPTTRDGMFNAARPACTGACGADGDDPNCPVHGGNAR